MKVEQLLEEYSGDLNFAAEKLIKVKDLEAEKKIIYESPQKNQPKKRNLKKTFKPWFDTTYFVLCFL